MRQRETWTERRLWLRAGVRPASALVSLALCLTATVRAAPERFPDQMRGSDLLALLAAGPAPLSPDRDPGIMPPPGEFER